MIRRAGPVTVLLCDRCPWASGRLEVFGDRAAVRLYARTQGWYAVRGSGSRVRLDLCPACRGDRPNPDPLAARRAAAAKAVQASLAARARRSAELAQDVAELIAAGESHEQVARRLGVTPRTVRNRLRRAG